MRLKWARSIGMWGRVKTTAAIAAATGATAVQVRSYKAKDETRRPGGKAPLQTRDTNGARSQLDLAVAFAKPRGLGRACVELGVLRIEARLYEDFADRLDLRQAYAEAEGEVPKDALLDDVREAIVATAGLRVALPPERWGTLATDDD
jgi:hypothetical protein